MNLSETNYVPREQKKAYVTFRITGQMFGIAVEQVQDVLRRQKLTPIPLAPKKVKGAVNLRGRIVTVINLREALGLPFQEGVTPPMNIVVEHRGELFSLWVDSVGDVLTLSEDDFDKTPGNLSGDWQQFVQAVYQLENELLLILDVAAIIRI